GEILGSTPERQGTLEMARDVVSAALANDHKIGPAEAQTIRQLMRQKRFNAEASAFLNSMLPPTADASPALTAAMRAAMRDGKITSADIARMVEACRFPQHTGSNDNGTNQLRSRRPLNQNDLKN